VKIIPDEKKKETKRDKKRDELKSQEKKVNDKEPKKSENIEEKIKEFLKIGNNFFAKDQYEKAIDEFNKMIKLYPKHKNDKNLNQYFKKAWLKKALAIQALRIASVKKRTSRNLIEMQTSFKMANEMYKE